MDKQGFAVSEVNQYLKQLLESQSELHHIPVLGEISNFKRYGSGHCYFTLKDEKSALKCVMFKSSAAHLSFKDDDIHPQSHREKGHEGHWPDR